MSLWVIVACSACGSLGVALGWFCGYGIGYQNGLLDAALRELDETRAKRDRLIAADEAFADSESSDRYPRRGF